MSKRLVPLIKAFGLLDGIVFLFAEFLKKMVFISLAVTRQIFISETNTPTKLLLNRFF
jgi:hypothetical protein